MALSYGSKVQGCESNEGGAKRVRGNFLAWLEGEASGKLNNLTANKLYNIKWLHDLLYITGNIDVSPDR